MVKINGEQIKGLVDTGATRSLIAERLVKNKQIIRPTTSIIVDASNSRIPLIGEVLGNIKTNTGSFTEKLLVVSENSALKMPFILGMNILDKAIIDIPNKEIRFTQLGGSNMTKEGDELSITIESYTLDRESGNSQIEIINSSQLKDINDKDVEKLKGQNKDEVNIHLLRDMVVKENAITVCSIEAPKNLKSGDIVVTHFSEHKGGIVTPNCVSKVSEGKITLNIVNIHDTPKYLKQGTRICTANLLKEEQLHKLGEGQPKQLDREVRLEPLTEDDIICGDKEVSGKLVHLLNSYRHTVWKDDEPLGKFNGSPMEIQLTQNKVVNKAPYRIPHALQEKMQEHLDRMLQEGIITRSSSSYNSPLLIVPKGDNDIRPCIDYRGLNAITKPICYPIPRILELLSQLKDIKVMSSIDLASAYHQCPIREQDQEYTAFTFKNTKYQFRRVPFGLTSAPSYFSRIIQETLFHLLGDSVTAYFDDIIIYSANKEDHLQKIEQVLTSLAKVNLKIKLQKSQFFVEKVKFLGYVISNKGLQMDQARVDSIKQMPDPDNKRKVQIFLGICNYFRQFIKGFASIAEPLYKLLRKNTKFEWTEKQKQAVQILKERLSTAPILKFPDFSRTFHIYSDASDYGIAGCLMQCHDGILHPLSYASRSLNPAQRNYSTTKKEALALTFTLENYRDLVLHYKVQVYTDHAPLLAIMKKRTKDACITRWTLLIQEYGVNLNYLPGKRNIFSDAASRLIKVQQNCEDVTKELEDKLVSKINSLAEEVDCPYLDSLIPEKMPWTEEELREHQKKDKTCREIVESLLSPAKETTTKVTKFRILKDLLYVYRKITRGPIDEQYLVPYIPTTLMGRALRTLHDETTAGHKGPQRTLQYFVKNGFNKQETKIITDYCNNCEVCIQAKAAPKAIPIGKYPVPVRPFETISSDLIGPLPLTESGNRYIMVVRDFTTRYTLLVPIRNKEADNIINGLRQVISNYGSSRTLLTDNAREYTSEKMVSFCKFYNISKREVTPYHPSSQGIVERINREVNKFLRIYSHTLNTGEWDDLLPVLQLTINNTYNASLGETPFYALYGYDSPTTTWNPPKLNYSETDLAIRLKKVAAVRNYCREHVLKIQSQFTTRINANRKDKPVEIGDRVFAKLNKHQAMSKLDLPISGPFTITEKKGNKLTIKSMTTHDTFHIHSDSIISNVKNHMTNMTNTVDRNESMSTSEKKVTPYNLRPRN